MFLLGRIKTGTGEMDSGIKCTLNKFADNTKLCGAADTLERKDAIQRDLVRLGGLAHATPRRFNKVECKVLHMGQDKLKHKYRLCRELIESQP